MVALTRKQKVHVVILNAGIVAAGVGAGWLGDRVPESVPLFVVQGIMLLCLGVIFRLQLHKACLLALLGAFPATVLYWGLSTWTYGSLADYNLLASVLLASGTTVAAGGLYNLLLWELAHRGGPDHPLLLEVVEASRKGPILSLVSSAPMVIALFAMLLVLDAWRSAEILLRAKGGLVPLRIEYPLIDWREGVLHLSGQPEGASERVDIEVRDSRLAAALTQQVIEQRVPRQRVVALLPSRLATKRSFVVDSGWEASVTVESNYWYKVRGRLYLLVIGLLGTLSMVWLGHHRSERAAARRESAQLPIAAPS